MMMEGSEVEKRVNLERAASSPESARSKPRSGATGSKSLSSDVWP